MKLLLKILETLNTVTKTLKLTLEVKKLSYLFLAAKQKKFLGLLLPKKKADQGQKTLKV